MLRRAVRALMIGVAAIIVVSGCATPAARSGLVPSSAEMLGDSADQRLTLETSLFKEDQEALSNEDLARILTAEIRLPASAKLAVVRFGNAPYWWGWSEQFVRVNDEIDANFFNTLGHSNRLREVAYLPSLVTPEKMTLPLLRQASARFQADLLLVYRTTNRTFDRSRFFRADETRAYCTVEAILLDVRTGIVPFSTVVNEQYSATRQKDDYDFSETVAKASQQAFGRATVRLAQEVVGYLHSAPKRSATRPADEGMAG